MDHLDRLESDLNFVRNVVNGSARSKSPSSLYFLWAVIVAIGFSLVDFRVELVPQYWAVAGPAGFLVSAYLGWSYAQRIGQPSSSPSTSGRMPIGSRAPIIMFSVSATSA